MTNSTFIAAIATAAAILGCATTASAQTCDPSTFSQDPAAYADLEADGFDDMTRGWYEDASFVRDLEYTGGTAVIGSGCNFYGLENDPDSSWNCTDSGGNVIEMLGDMTLTPLVAANRIAFDHSRHFGPFNVAITLSDGTTRTFSVEETHPSDWGWDVNYGFFGYSTCDHNLTIVDVALSNEDSAIDNVRLGVVEAPADTCDDTPASCVANCDLDSLDDKVIALGAPDGLTNALLVKIANAKEKLEDGQPETAANVLDALANQLEAQAGKKIDAGDAAELMACIETIIANL